MGEIYVISDTHFNHKNILQFKDHKGVLFRKRLFDSVSEMNETMIDNWNKVVTPQDKVYHLGDVYFGNAQEADTILKRLNGKKRLVLGNHDNPLAKPIWSNFKKVCMWRHFGHMGLLLTHVPVHLSALRRGLAKDDQRTLVNIHGHIHQNKSPDGPYKCVCVEQVNYTPVNIEEFRQW